MVALQLRERRTPHRSIAWPKRNRATNPLASRVVLR
jgi:hypothetical protein